MLRYERFDHGAGVQQHFARLNADAHTLFPQALAALAFVHFGVHIQCGKQRVERAGGRVQHKGVIETLMVAVTILSFDVFVFFMDLRGL
ncbi:hypothetical protein D3C75_1059470 [compost metagenome]